MKKYFEGIGGKLVKGYFYLVIVANVITITVVYQSFANMKSDEEINNKYFPSLINLYELINTIESTEKLIYNWIHLPSNIEQEKLNTIFLTTYPNFKKKYSKYFNL